jgi:modulator of FtsH protease
MLAAADAAFRMSDWHDFAVMLGGAAAALTGLVFVAVSIQLRTLAVDPSLRRRASSSLLFLFTIVAASAAVLAPQSPRAVGAEFLALVLLGTAVGRPGAAVALKQTNRLDKVLVAVRTPTGVLGIIADLSLISERGSGMYLAAPCLVITLGVTLGSAWAVLVAAAEESPRQD